MRAKACLNIVRNVMQCSMPETETRPTWHLTVAYAGTRYAGWQIQPDAKTVQGEIQRRLRHLFRDDALTIAGTSRTDAGVHALDQHVSFRPSSAAEEAISPARLCELMNRWLPEDIRILKAAFAPDTFHARHSARAKAYTYTLRPGPCISPFESPFLWNAGYRLDLNRMQRGAAHFCGAHDFAAFSAKPSRQPESTVRTIHRFEVLPRNGHIYISIIGDSFLYKMVRTLVGYLVLTVGRDPSWTEADADALIFSGKRPPQLQTAPAEGLFLGRVFFRKGAHRGYAPVLPPQHAFH